MNRVQKPTAMTKKTDRAAPLRWRKPVRRESATARFSTIESSKKTAMMAAGMMKTMRRLFTRHVSFRQYESHGGIVGDMRHFSLGGNADARKTVDGEGDVLAACAFQKHMAGVTFEGDVEHGRLQARIGSAIAKAQKLRPDEQYGAVAWRESLDAAAAQRPETRVKNDFALAGTRHLAMEGVV